MSDKADGFTVFHARCGRKLGIYIAVIGEEYIGKTESFQFLLSGFCKRELTLTAWNVTAGFIGGCPIADIF